MHRRWNPLGTGTSAGSSEVPGSGWWALVLAAGRGSRLEDLTVRDGEVVPKQFCALRGRKTLLELALERAERTVRRERVAVVVAGEHRRWWRLGLPGVRSENRIVQPAERGTAAGILLPLLSIHRRDPGGSVVVLPSDHYVRREALFRAAMRQALGVAAARPEQLILLAVRPERPDPQLGWVVPSNARASHHLRSVARFREKPSAEEARRLLADGALVNTLVFAARIETLLDLYRRHLPEVLRPFEQQGWQTEEALEACYAEVPVRDFSRHLLQRIPSRLRVLEVAPCGWSDLGTPDGVARCLADLRSQRRPRARGGRDGASWPIQLAKRLAARHAPGP